MNTSPESYLTVRQHADVLAHETYGTSWREHRNDPLDQLFSAIWLDQFEDEITPCLLDSPDDVNAHKRGIRRRSEQNPIRMTLWRQLPKGGYWVPDAIRRAREDEHPWQEIAELSWDDYDDQWRRSIIEQVIILQPAFERWRARHWTGKPKKGGRKPGSGSYADMDAPLIEKMKTLIADGAASSPYGAALIIATEAKGGGTEQSKAKRLLQRFKESDIAG